MAKHSQGLVMSSLRRRMLQEQGSKLLQARQPIVWGTQTVIDLDEQFKAADEESKD